MKNYNFTNLNTAGVELVIQLFAGKGVQAVRGMTQRQFQMVLSIQNRLLKAPNGNFRIIAKASPTAIGKSKGGRLHLGGFKKKFFSTEKPTFE